jgi:hypothetical protein
LANTQEAGCDTIWLKRIANLAANEPAMPLSLRLPPPVEAQILDHAMRSGLSKTAIVLQSVQEYLARHAQPSAHQIYEEVMRKYPAMDDAAEQAHNTARDALETRPHKIKAREAARAKHAQRTARAMQARAQGAKTANPKP